ncbi:MAG: ribose 5-phosphate isomerase B [Planctomycetes bacterium]|nr:ribose 5-phosphate isomerase B [Planctomycetota bacterium]
MKVAIAGDHAALELRAIVLKTLKDLGHEVQDLGPHTGDSVDYPDFAKAACQLVAKGEAERAILVCGSGVGMAISANKIKGCRAAVLHNEFEAEMTRKHNNANVACFGQRQHGPAIVERCLKIFMTTEFEGGRHKTRVDKMNALEGF